MKTLAYFLAAVVLLSHGTAQPVAADPIVITSGSMLVTGPFESGSVRLIGTRGFSLRSLVDPAEGEVSAINKCGSENPDACLGGSTISIGTNLVASAFPSGTATLDGVTFPDIGDANSPATVLLRLAGSVTLPAFEQSPVVLTAPFAIGESAFLFPLEQVPIRGAGGIATLSLVPGRNGEGTPTPWIVDQILYDFTGTAAPVPEPGTMLLVATGLLGALRARRAKADRTSVRQRGPSLG
jgi:hypothetical protein